MFFSLTKKQLFCIYMDNGVFRSVRELFKKLKSETYIGILTLAAVLLLATGGVHKLAQMQAVTNESQITVAVDAGHGGRDPGKEGVNGSLEKDINLAISLELKEELESKGIHVVMTRENDDGLYDENAASKKQSDMHKRCEIIDESGAVLTVSIHQNSYSSESVSGPQVFYYTHSDGGKEAAGFIQKALNEQLEVEREREMKANDSYYLLTRTKSPTIIVECGFLSNHAEAKKLDSRKYQKKVAEAICGGVMEYLKEQ